MNTQNQDQTPAAAPDAQAPHAYTRRIDCAASPRQAEPAQAPAPAAAHSEHPKARKGDCA